MCLLVSYKLCGKYFCKTDRIAHANAKDDVANTRDMTELIKIKSASINLVVSCSICPENAETVIESFDVSRLLSVIIHDQHVVLGRVV